MLKAKISNINPADAKKIENLQSELKSLTSDYRYEMAQAAVDAVGIVDPTPVSDIVGAGMSIASGDYIGAGLSLISAFPYVGDALGKSAKAARAAKRIAAIQKKIKKATEALVAAKKRAEKVSKAAAKTRAAKKAAAAKQAAKNKVKQDCPPFSGTLRGKAVELKNVKTKKIKYTKRPTAELDKLRKAFNSTERAKFLKSLANDPKKIKQLEKSGLNSTQLKQLKNGKVPAGYQVHHKIPIDDGGTNALDNLILIKNEPYHKVITNFQNKNLGGMKPGESKTIDFPVPDGFVYP